MWGFPKKGVYPPNIHFSLGCSSQETIYWGQPLPRWLAMALRAWNPCATRMMRSAKCWRCRKTSRDPLGVSNGSVMLFFLHEVWWFNVIQWWSNESNGMNGDLWKICYINIIVCLYIWDLALAWFNNQTRDLTGPMNNADSIIKS